MANSPSVGYVPYFTKNGTTAASGWWIKAYVPGTTTPIPIYQDASTDNPMARAEINKLGLPITSGGVIFAPHFGRKHDLWLFPTAAEADANNTTNAIKVVSDGIVLADGQISSYESVESFIKSVPPSDSVNIISYYGGWSGTVEGPKGGFTAHRTGYTADSPSVGDPVAPSTIGTGEQAGIFWTADGAEWRRSFAGIWKSSRENYEVRVNEPTLGQPTLIIGHPNNDIHPTVSASFVYGGTANSPHSLGEASELSVIGGGYDNHIGDDATASTIAGGAHHNIADGASHAAVLGGSYQTVTADYGAAVAGTQNRVNATWGVVVGGQENEAGDPSAEALDVRSSFVGAGAQNKAHGLRSAVVSGFQNTASGPESIVGAGRNNVSNGEQAVVAGGLSNIASGQQATVVGGTSNEASGLASIVGGSAAKAAANFAVALGEFLEASASVAVATGSRCKAYLRGQRAHAAGYFEEKGDAQISDLVGRFETTGSSSYDLDLNGGISSKLVLPDNATWGFTARVTARRVDAPGEHARYIIEGLIVRENGAASTTLKAATTTVVHADSPAWDVVASADVTNGALRITCTGEASKTIRWVGRIELEEVAG